MYVSCRFHLSPEVQYSFVVSPINVEVNKQRAQMVINREAADLLCNPHTHASRCKFSRSLDSFLICADRIKAVEERKDSCCQFLVHNFHASFYFVIKFWNFQWENFSQRSDMLSLRAGLCLTTGCIESPIVITCAHHFSTTCFFLCSFGQF